MEARGGIDGPRSSVCKIPENAGRLGRRSQKPENSDEEEMKEMM